MGCLTGLGGLPGSVCCSKVKHERIRLDLTMTRAAQGKKQKCLTAKRPAEGFLASSLDTEGSSPTASRPGWITSSETNPALHVSLNFCSANHLAGGVTGNP